MSGCGWVVFALLCVHFFPDVSKPDAGLPLAIIFIGILLLNIVFYIITFVIYVYEKVRLKRITSEKFLNNKVIKIFQLFGIFLAFLPLIMLALYLVEDFIKDITS